MTAHALPVASARRPLPVRAGLALLLPLAAVVGVAAANGGFFATAFGWTGLAFAWVLLIAVVLVAPRWWPVDCAWALAGLALCAVVFLSALWAGDAGTAVNQGLRMLVYATGVAAGLAVIRRRDVELWLGGLALGAGAIAFYALATRLLPDHFGAFNADAGYRLFVPIGYWNGLGVFAAMGALLALGLATSARRRTLRVLAATTLVVLLPTLYYTYSRGSWAAFFLGFVVLLATGRQLVGVLWLSLVPALAVLLAARPAALTDQLSPLAAATHAGHRLAVVLAVLALGQAAAALVLTAVTVPALVRRSVAVAVAVGVLAGAGAVVAHYGSPATLARHAYDSFTAAPTSASAEDLNGRLFSLSNNGRTVPWRAAWHEYLAHPLLGGGAGSFQRWWDTQRTTAYDVEDAHDLYAQMLGELGIVGGALLAAFLAVPLVAARRALRDPLAAGALAAYVAWLAHCVVDWDWQLPSVTLLALFAGVGVVAAARGDRETGAGPLSPRTRMAIAFLAGAAAVVSFVGLIGNIALARAGSSVTVADGPRALAQARKAVRWAPWSTEAMRALGEAEVLTGRRAAGLAELRRAARRDPGDWQTWFDIASVASGREHAAAIARVRALDPAGSELQLLEHPPAL